MRMRHAASSPCSWSRCTHQTALPAVLKVLQLRRITPGRSPKRSARANRHIFVEPQSAAAIPASLRLVQVLLGMSRLNFLCTCTLSSSWSLPEKSPHNRSSGTCTHEIQTQFTPTLPRLSAHSNVVQTSRRTKAAWASWRVCG